jgi:hypothetical protein
MIRWPPPGWLAVSWLYCWLLSARGWGRRGLAVRPGAGDEAHVDGAGPRSPGVVEDGEGGADGLGDGWPEWVTSEYGIDTWRDGPYLAMVMLASAQSAGTIAGRGPARRTASSGVQ